MALSVTSRVRIAIPLFSVTVGGTAILLGLLLCKPTVKEPDVLLVTVSPTALNPAVSSTASSKSETVNTASSSTTSTVLVPSA